MGYTQPNPTYSLCLTLIFMFQTRLSLEGSRIEVLNPVGVHAWEVCAEAPLFPEGHFLMW